jgi:DNA transformation protein and related proteins
MASDPSFVQYVCDQIARAGTITHRRMFGEYAVYCNGKVVALVCNNQLFIKPTDAARAFMGQVAEAPPYHGAKLYFLITDQLDDQPWITTAIRLTADALPVPVAKKPKVGKTKKAIVAGSMGQ